MSYIKKLLRRDDDAFDALEADLTAVSDEMRQIAVEQHSTIDTHLNGIQATRDRLNGRMIDLQRQIAELNEELRQVTVTVSAYDLAVDALKEQMPIKDNSTPQHFTIRHVHHNINSGDNNDAVATSKNE